MRVLAVLLFAACSGPAQSTSEPAAPALAPRLAKHHGLGFVIRNGSTAPLDLLVGLGDGELIEIIDEAGALAPSALYAPPQVCEGACSEPPKSSCDAPAPGVTLAPNAIYEIVWDGSLRHDRPREPYRCFDRAAAPAGRYLARACSADGRCATQHFELPRSTPIELVLRDREAGVPPCDRASLHRAARVALGAARVAGVSDAALAGCATIDPVCGGGESSDRPGECRISVTAAEARYEVAVHPAAQDGAPLAYTAWLDREGIGVGNTWLTGERWGVAGAVRVVGAATSAIHTHGGDAAAIGDAAFHAYNEGKTPAHVALRSASWLHDGECNLPGAPIALPGARLEMKGGAILAPGADAELSVSFSPRGAYQGSCDRFGVEVELDIDGAIVHTATEIHVSRVEPRHR